MILKGDSVADNIVVTLSLDGYLVLGYGVPDASGIIFSRSQESHLLFVLQWRKEEQDHAKNCDLPTSQ